MTLSQHEIERYARHIVMRDIGGGGQQKFKAARVLVVGAGGLGAPILLYLAAAGIGTLGLIDDDVVSLSNLQRQVLYGVEDIGKPKVEVGVKHLQTLNPLLTYRAHICRLDEANARAIIAEYDIIVDGSDNFATRYLVSDTCYLLGKTLITGAVGVFDGSLTTIKAHIKGNPTYRCIFPQNHAANDLPACSQAGIIGVLTGMVGTMMANEVLREVAGFGEGLVGKLLLIDSFSMRFSTIDYDYDPKNALNGEANA
jgi:molybdopterin-synthase adenylyltransferase